MSFNSFIKSLGSAVSSVNPLIGAGVSVLGGILGSKNVSKTNDLNLQIARETNQANMDTLHEQQDWALQQWNMQNEYNTPTAQRRRLEDAGLNPMFYGLDGNSTGQVPQPASAPAIGAQMQPDLSMPQSILNAANIMADARLKQAQAENLEEDTKSKEINNLTLAIRNNKDIDLQDLNIKLANANLNLTEEQARKVAEEVISLREQIRIANEQLKLDIRKLSFDEFMRKVEHHLKEQQFEQEKYEFTRNVAIALYNAETNRINANTNERLANSTIDVNGYTVQLVSKQTASQEMSNRSQAIQLSIEEKHYNGRLGPLDRTIKRLGIALGDVITIFK